MQTRSLPLDRRITQWAIDLEVFVTVLFASLDDVLSGRAAMVVRELSRADVNNKSRWQTLLWFCTALGRCYGHEPIATLGASHHPPQFLIARNCGFD